MIGWNGMGCVFKMFWVGWWGGWGKLDFGVGGEWTLRGVIAVCCSVCVMIGWGIGEGEILGRDRKGRWRILIGGKYVIIWGF